MPRKPPRPCRVPGCAGKTTASHGYCEAHAHLAKAWSSRKTSSGKATSGRGGRPWRRLRDRILTRDCYLCQTCLRAGRITPATEVDHIINRESGGTDDPSNLEAICTDCHKAKTQREAQQGRRRVSG